MAGTLKDQLLKAGLVTPDKARKLERQARAEKQNRSTGKTVGKGSKVAPEPSAVAEAKKRAQAINHEKAERDRAQMRTIADKARARALRAEIKQIVTQNDQRVNTNSDEDVAYNFVHGKRVKRIYVLPAQREQISNGTLVIVNNDGLYHLLSRKAAEKIRARDPKRIVVDHQAKESEPGSDDEYYAKFEVPDDLDW